MKTLRTQLAHAVGSLLLLEATQVVFETVALLAVYRGQILPPYEFFPNQAYDFLLKLRYLFDPVLGWLPSLPDSFLVPSTLAHLRVVAGLLPAGVAMALVIGAGVGLLGWLVGWHSATWKRYLIVWLVLGIAVHGTLALQALRLNDDPSVAKILYRARSFVVDGTVVAVGVLAASLLVTAASAERLRSARRLRNLGVAALLACSLALAVGTATRVAGEVPEASAELSALPPRSPYNVVLISLDSLRADHIGAYGYKRNTSPSIDRFARDAVLFKNAIATSSWTLPTHLTMFTSRYQISHGVVEETLTLSPQIRTLPEVLKAAGYTTAGFVSAPYLAARYGYSRGMDVYEDVSARYAHRSEARSAIVSPHINAMALPWLEEHKDDTFFLFLHYFDIHYDYIPPPPYDTMFDPDYEGSIDGTDFIERPDVNKRMDRRDLAHIIALYDGEIRFTDEHVGQILQKIDELGLRANTLVIVVSDHGDEFFEHGNKGHHRTLYDEVLRIPLIMRFPHGAHAGAIIEEQISLVDLMPTILDVVGLDGPRGMEGLSFVPFLESGRPTGRARVYAEFFDKRGFNLQVASRDPERKVIQHFNRLLHPRSPAIEHYRLVNDRAEQKNVASQRTDETRAALYDLAAWLNDRWAAHRKLTAREGSNRRVELDEDTMERLRSLGYAGN